MVERLATYLPFCCHENLREFESHRLQYCSRTFLGQCALLLDGLDHNKVPYKVKARIQPPLHYPRIEMINILNSWYKSLPIILLP